MVVSRACFGSCHVDPNKILLQHEKFAQHRAELPDQRSGSAIFAHLRDLDCDRGIGGQELHEAAAGPSPTVEKRRATETREIPFQTRTVNDASLPKGTQKVRTKGVPGVKTLTYEVTFTNGVETGRQLISETVTKQPVTQVVAVGTKAASNCDPNYTGACVPIASDVDCAGGSGNGPAYVQGPVTVVGKDI